MSVRGSTEQTAVLAEGYRLQQAGRLAEAESIYRRVLRRAPGHPDALYLLASIALAVGRHADASGLLERALIARPDDVSILFSLGYALEAQQRWAEALDVYRRASEVDPGQAEIFNNLGNVLYVRGDVGAAIEAYRRAVEIRPDYHDARLHLGHALKAAGDVAAAESAYREVLEAEPDRCETYRSLGQVKRYRQDDDPDLVTMRSLLARPDLPAVDAMHLHFALGKACHETGFAERAFGHWREANRIMRDGYDYDVAEEAELVARVESFFTAECLSSRDDVGRPDARPIFIVGMPRSGSTLVEQILGSHPEVSAAGELVELRRAIHAHGQFPVSEAGYPEEAVVRAADDYLERMRFYNLEGRPRQTDKTLFNFFYIGMIRWMFPNAAVVCCWRDPFDTCLSCYRHYFPEIRRFVYDLGELGRFYGLFAELMAHWREVLPGYVHEIHYEDLVDSPESEIRRLLVHCGLDWDDACLRFHENRRAAKTASATQVRRPIDRAGIGRWRRYAPWLGELRQGLAERSGRIPDRYRVAIDDVDGFRVG